MKHLDCLILVFALLFCGCSKHQYLIFTSDLQQTNTDVYYSESDSLKLEYRFIAPSSIAVTIHNKMPAPIMINWMESYITINNQRNAMLGNDLIFKDLDEYLNTATDTTFIGFYGTVKGGASQTFLPPKGIVSSLSKHIVMPHNPQLLNGLKAEKSDLHKAKVKKYTFIKSGAYARLIFSIQIETTAGTSFTQSDNFWVSQVLETANGELDLDKNQLRQEKSK